MFSKDKFALATKSLFYAKYILHKNNKCEQINTQVFFFAKHVKHESSKLYY